MKDNLKLDQTQYGVYWNSANNSYTIEDSNRWDGYLLTSFGGYSLLQGFWSIDDAKKYLDDFKSL